MGLSLLSVQDLEVFEEWARAGRGRSQPPGRLVPCNYLGLKTFHFWEHCSLCDAFSYTLGKCFCFLSGFPKRREAHRQKPEYRFTAPVPAVGVQRERARAAGLLRASVTPQDVTGLQLVPLEPPSAAGPELPHGQAHVADQPPSAALQPLPSAAQPHAGSPARAPTQPLVP